MTHLHDLPRFAVAEPYRIRWYTDAGDDDRWMKLKTASDVHHSADFFAQTYGEHRDLLAQRQAFPCDGRGEAVGTVTAWLEDLGGARQGKVNWMLLVPGAQGAGLSEPLLSACCARYVDCPK